MSSFAATWLGLASLFQDLASAFGGAIGLAASPTLVIGAILARRSGATIDDLLRNARGDYREIGPQSGSDKSLRACGSGPA
jgi:hypothetical protein